MEKLNTKPQLLVGDEIIVKMDDNVATHAYVVDQCKNAVLVQAQGYPFPFQLENEDYFEFVRRTINPKAKIA